MQAAFVRVVRCNTVCAPAQVLSHHSVRRTPRAGWPSHVTAISTTVPPSTRSRSPNALSGNLFRCAAYADVAAIRDIAEEADEAVPLRTGQRRCASSCTSAAQAAAKFIAGGTN